MASEKKLKILLVDDNEFVLNATEKLFQVAGDYHVDMVTSAEAAIDNLSQVVYDLVITDVEMGPKDANGLELLRSIRTGRTLAATHTPVVVLTSYAEKPIIGAAIALDTSGFLAKPVRLDSLIKKTKEAIQVKLHLRPAIAYDVIPCREIAANASAGKTAPPFPLPEPDETSTSNAAPQPPAAEDATEATTEATQASAPEPESATPEPRGISVYSLRSGMKIITDIKSSGGAVFVESGTVLTEATVTQLRQMSDILDTKFIKVEDEHKYMRYDR